MSKKIIVTVAPYESRAALLRNDQPFELFFESRETETLTGCIYKGRVANIVPGMQSAFVDIGLPKDAFLAFDEVDGDSGGDSDVEFKELFKTPIQDMLKVGQEVVIQVLKDPTATKGPRSTMYLSIPGRYLVLTPTVPHVGVSRRIQPEAERDRLRAIGKKLCPKGMGMILRTATEGLEEAELAADLRFLLKIWEKIDAKSRSMPIRSLLHRDLSLPLKLVRDYFDDTVEEFLIDSPEEYRNILDFCDFLSPLQRASLELYEGSEPLFAKYGIDNETEQALKSKVWLKSGGYLFIQRTEALTAIDVNSGRYAGGADLEDTVFQVNLEAAREIARQVSLRNLSGILILDFIDMHSGRHRDQVMKTLREAFRGDRNRPHFVEFSELGLVQMTRRRTAPTLEEQLKQKCPCCEGAGWAFSPGTIGNRIRRELMLARPVAPGSRYLIFAHDEVIKFLAGPNSGKHKELERRFGAEIVFKSDPMIKIEEFKIEPL